MTTTSSDATVLFLESSRRTLLELYWPRLQQCVESLTDEQVWWRPNEACNSIGNLILHLNGNVRQWIVASFNGIADQRDRPAEFGERELIAASALLEMLGATLEEASGVLARLTGDDLLARREIQGRHAADDEDRPNEQAEKWDGLEREAIYLLTDPDSYPTLWSVPDLGRELDHFDPDAVFAASP